MERADSTRDCILEAARGLFGHYGFAKTTMVEIADKCHMSAANIYRFFPGKEDIVAAIAERYFKEVEASLREVLQRKSMTAAFRLEVFILQMVRGAHSLSCCNEKMSDAVRLIESKRGDLVARHFKTLQSMIAEILAEGNRSGEFEVDDVVGTGEVILNAAAFFQSPACCTSRSLEELEESTSRIVRLCIQGLGKR